MDTKPTSDSFQLLVLQMQWPFHGRAFFFMQNRLEMIGLDKLAIILNFDFANATTIFYGRAF